MTHELNMQNFIFVLLFVMTVGSACIVAFSKNLIYSAFALIGTFMGVAGTFVLLSADFLGLAQVVVYAGGILVLTIFAVMLTAKIGTAGQSNPVLNYKYVLPVMLILIVLLAKVCLTDFWVTEIAGTEHAPTASNIGHQLLNEYLLPFELISVVLLVSMIGAAIITRRHVKE